MNFFRFINAPIFLVDLSIVLGISFFIFSPTYLLITPVKTLILLSISYSLLTSFQHASILLAAYLLIQYTFISPLPLLGIFSLTAVHHYTKHALLPIQAKKDVIPPGPNPRKSNTFISPLSPFSYAPKLRALLFTADSLFGNSEQSFTDINNI